MDALARFSELEYLAVSSGSNPEPGVDVDALPLRELAKLRYLDVSNWGGGERVASPEALRAFAELHTLRWAAHLAAPIPAPCRLERYRSETLSETDAGALAACSALRELSSDGADFESAEPVRKWPVLERLHLRHWHATELAPLATLGKLRELSLPACKAVDYGVLGHMPTLRGVDLSQSGLTDLTVFASLPLLEELDVGFTPVRDLSPLRSLTHLTLLELNDTQVVELGPIAPLRALQKLTFSTTGVRRLEPIAGNPSLEWVILYRSQVTDASPLFTLPKLRRAHIGGLSLPGEQVERLRKKLGSDLND
jgi:Leucine-rich repeat (LRR) protein